MPVNDLESVIEDVANDLVDPDDTSDISVDQPDVSVDAGEEKVEQVQLAPTPSDAEGTSKEDEAKVSEAPLAEDKPAEDEFAKKFGLQTQSVTGRENRIPYSRVKKIVTKAQTEAKAEAKKEFEAEFQPRIQEFETKVKDYEERLENVAKFEDMLENAPKLFLDRLSQVPAYKPFFDYVNDLANKAAGVVGQSTKPAIDPNNDPRPLPNKALADGTKVYDLEGLDSLMEWQARQVEHRVLGQAEDRIAKRYGPMEEKFKLEQQRSQSLAVIDKQLAEARTWPNFTELEDKITTLLENDKTKTLSLDRAYMRAYQEDIVPKLVADKTKVRTEVLAELKKQPSSSSTPVRATAAKPQTEGPRDLTDIIAEVARGLQG